MFIVLQFPARVRGFMYLILREFREVTDLGEFHSDSAESEHRKNPDRAPVRHRFHTRFATRAMHRFAGRKLELDGVERDLQLRHKQVRRAGF